MGSNSRIALVANDQRVATAIQTTLKKNLKQPAFTCSADTIRDLVDIDTKGIMLLVSTDPTNAEQCRWLIQEIRLRKLAPVIVLIDGEENGSPAYLDGLAPYVTLRVRWPDDEMTLVDWVRRHLGQCQPFPSIQEETLEDQMRRLLAMQTPSLLPLAQPLAIAATHDVNILLTGETGTGKTRLARMIHDYSPRQSHRFLPVGCGSLVDNLMESELFGTARGAFTGAEHKVGKFGIVGNGTILLDEIDALSLEQQTSLLRVIETGEYEPVGSTETKKCTARIIVASNWDIADAVEKGKFRRDLYYRLNVMFFKLPALRERVRDIEPLVRGMVARFANKFRKNLFEISPDAIHALEQFPWPGNIRELENAVQRAVLISSGSELLLKHLPVEILEHSSPSECHLVTAPINPTTATPNTANGKSLTLGREAYERNQIRKALHDANYSRTRAASLLGVSRVTLYKKMKKYGLGDIPNRPVGLLGAGLTASTANSAV